jgi:hypothetical protein
MSTAGIVRKEKMRSVTVRVPATSANLGPGYDCLGMAVRATFIRFFVLGVLRF